MHESAKAYGAKKMKQYNLDQIELNKTLVEDVLEFRRAPANTKGKIYRTIALMPRGHLARDEAGGERFLSKIP